MTILHIFLLLIFEAALTECWMWLADVVPYVAHVPSYADTWGWIMVSYSILVPSSWLLEMPYFY